MKREKMVTRDDLKQQASGLREIDFPRQVLVEPINWCNLNCIMCPSGDLTRKRGMMELDLFRKIVDEMAREDPTTKLWPAIMGEPLLAGERLYEMLAYARSCNIGVYLNTNATLLTETAINRIQEHGVKEVIVGIDALTKKTYDRIRRGGDFEMVCRNIKRMLKKYRSQGPKVILQYIVMKENEHEAEDFKRYWLEKGAIIKLRLKQGWGDLIGSEYLKYGQEDRFMPCPWLIRNLLVLWDGEVCQCDGDVDNRYSCGNIYKQTLKQVWQGEMRARRQRHFRGDFDFEPCKSCKDWQVGLSKFYYPDNPEHAYTVDERKE